MVWTRDGMILRNLWKREYLFSVGYQLTTKGSCIFRYIFIPWLQHELDEYVVKNNTTKKRHNRKIAHPNGVLLLIEQAPEHFNAQDYKVNLEMLVFNEIVKSPFLGRFQS